MPTALARQSLRIFRAALGAADPRQAVLAHLKIDRGTLKAGRKIYHLDRFQNIYVAGAGKASVKMAASVLSGDGSRSRTAASGLSPGGRR